MKTFYFLFVCSCFVFSLSAQDPAGWRYSYLPNNRPANAIHVIDSKTFVAAGGNETNDKIRTICRSKDGGYTWESIFDFVDSSWLKSMYFINAETGFVAGYESVVLKTTDGGQTWTHVVVPMNVATRNFNSIFFVDSQTGFIAGGNRTNDSIQTILKTTDGGNSWSIQRDVPGYWIKAIYFTDINNGYATGENGVALKSADGGDTWSQMALPGSVVARVYNTIFFLDSNTGLLGGGNEANDSIQTILKTTDGGASWNIVRDSVAPWISSIQFYNSTTGFAAGDDGTLLVTHDGGYTWNSAGVPDSVDGGFTHHRFVYFPNSDFGIVGGTFGKIMFYNAPSPTAAIAYTDVATNTTTTGTTFNGTVNANGNTTAVSFEYWTATGNVTTVSAQPDSISGSTSIAVNSAVSGLTTNTLYYFRVKAQNTNGTSYGDLRQIYIGNNPIPNWDFEIWDTIERFVPQRWLSAGEVAQVPSYDGSYAAKLKGSYKREFGALLHGLPNDNGIAGGVPFFARPDTMVGFFNYDIAAGDSAMIILWFKRNGVFNSQQFYYLTGSSGGNFQRLSFPISYSDANIPDSVILGILSTNAIFGVADTNSLVIVDNISFLGTNQNVPNNNLESWYTDTIETLNSWYQEYPVAGVVQNVIQTADRQHGRFAAKLQNNVNGTAEVGRIETGPDGPAFPVYQKHLTFNFFMKYFPSPHDTLDINVSLYAAGQQVAFFRLLIDTMISDYTPFSLPLNYTMNTVPDSGNISIRASKFGTSGNSVLYIDNLSFDGFYLDVKEYPDAGKKDLNWNIYPNPAQDEILVKGTGNNIEDVIISVLNLNGELMKKQNNRLQAGNYEVALKLENLPSGIYIVTLQKQGSVQFRKLVIAK